MAITATDIKLLESERMTDSTDGGGRRTSRVIADGAAGNIFPKVSRLDSVYGRVNLRKIYGAVLTDTLDTYAGAHAVVMREPQDPLVQVAMFSTASDFDTRTQARDRIESYVIAGPESRMILLGRQLVGQGAITTYQMIDDALPEPGDVYALSKEVGGATVYQQYVRVTDVSHEVRVLEDDRGTFQRRVITLKLANVLRYEFRGPDSPVRSTAVLKEALVRRTTVADAARYFGIKALAQPAAAGALDLSLDSVYTQIVPTTNRETGLANAPADGATSTIAGAPSPVPERPISRPLAEASVYQTLTLNLPGPLVPGTLALRLSGPSFFPSTDTVVDNGAGVIPATTNATALKIVSGTVDYRAGVLILTVLVIGGYGGGAVMARWTPAVEVTQTAHTLEVPVTLATRGTVYTRTLAPLPAPGTLRLSYRALGRWITLRDDGSGSLSGDDVAYGVGSINYSSGALIASLGALPDVGSSVLLSWGSPVHYATLTGARTLVQEITAASLPLDPATVALNWTSGGVTKTATGTAGGTLSGNCTGTIDATTGRIRVEYNAAMPDAGSTLTLGYTQLVPSTSAPTVKSGEIINVASIAAFSLGTSVTPRSLSMNAPASVINAAAPGGQTVALLTDNGAGQLVTVATPAINGNTVVGTIDYATGDCSITGAGVYNYATWTSAEWAAQATPMTLNAGEWVASWRTGATSTTTPVTETVTLAAAPLAMDLTPTLQDAVVPGSLLFTLGGRLYFDRGAGTVYVDIDPATGSAMEAGHVDYTTGVVTFGTWTSTVTGGVANVVGCLTRHGRWTAQELALRVAGSPLRPAATVVHVTAADGATLIGTTNEAGVLTGAGMEGTVNQEMGIISVRFGAWETAAGKETEPWYRPENVLGTMVWHPRDVAPETLRYDTVVLTSLPLDADVLGLDPVRLPSDGRVPIFRPADVVVVHHTDTVVLPNPAAAGATYSAGRTDLGDLWITDAAGARIDPALYVADLAAGTATMSAALDLTGVAQPMVLHHRIEDTVRVSGVQINGQITIERPLSRAYPTGARVSSALLFGDLRARVFGVFDQSTFNGVWSDALIGSQATAQYDDVNHPIEVLNSGAVTERWRINFTSATSFQVIGEQLGVIATGTTTADVQPTNPLTGKAYFTLRASGWGAGWSAGNQLRFNTAGAAPPSWLVRTVLPGASVAGDSFDMQLRGDVDV